MILVTHLSEACGKAVHHGTYTPYKRITNALTLKEKVTKHNKTSLCTARKRALDVSKSLSSMEENVFFATPKVELIKIEYFVG